MLDMAMLVSHLNWSHISLQKLLLQGKMLHLRLHLMLMAQEGHGNPVPNRQMVSERASSHTSIDNSHERK